MSCKKKILMVVHNWGIGGVRTSVVNLSNALHQRGHDVTIVVTSKQEETSHSLLPGIRFLAKDEKKSRIFSKLPYFKHFWGSGMWSQRKSPKKLYKHFVGKEKFDVEIAQFFGRPLKVVYGSSNQSSKKLAWIHSDFSYGKNKGCFSGFKSQEEAIQAYHSFDAVICASNGVRDSFEKVIGRKDNNFVVYNLNNIHKIQSLSREPIEVKKDKFTFIFVGRLSEEKGVMRLLNCIKRLNELGFSFDCWIVGDGAERQVAEEYVQANNLNNVVLLGEKINPYAYMKQADVLVLPSKAEAYGLSVAEALILNTPVLATNSVGPRELLGEGQYGLLVENHEEDIYEGMKALLVDSDLVNAYREKARERAEFFKEERILEQLEEIIS